MSSTITRNPTMVASCGCPYDPEYDEGHLGWHLRHNHPEFEYLDVKDRVTYSHRNVWFGCVDGASSEHKFTVNKHFIPNVTVGIHMLVCDRCGVHLHATFDHRDVQEARR